MAIDGTSFFTSLIPKSRVHDIARGFVDNVYSICVMLREGTGLAAQGHAMQILDRYGKSLDIRYGYIYPLSRLET